MEQETGGWGWRLEVRHGGGEEEGGAAWPERRHAHSAVLVWPKGRASLLCVYGGIGDGGRPLDDLFLFDLREGRWRPAAVMATKKSNRTAVAAAKSVTPAGRHSHTAVVWRDSMFVFGGATADPSGVPSDELLEFNFRKGVWSEVMSKGHKPTPRWGHSAVVVLRPQPKQSDKRKDDCNDGDDSDAAMWVFGGLTEAGSDNSLFRFHFRSRTWELVEAGAEAVVPSARHLHSAVVSPDGESMIVVGGFGGSTNHADAFCFHFGKREWSELAVPASLTGRRGHRAAIARMAGEDVMAVHGGHDKSGPLADLHLFRFADKSWSKAEGDEREPGEGSSASRPWPSSRYFHSLTACADSLWMFGGLGVDDAHHQQEQEQEGAKGKPRNLNDLHQLSLSRSQEDVGFCGFGGRQQLQLDTDVGGGQTMAKRFDFVEALSSEISLHILSFVPRSQVGASLPLVSRRWKWFVEDDALWRDALHKVEHMSDKEAHGSDDGDGKNCKDLLKEALANDPFHDT